MRILIVLMLSLSLVGCVLQKQSPAVLHGKDASVAAAENLPPSVTDTSDLKDESYHCSFMPWLVDNVTKTIVAKDIHRAIYHPQDSELQIEYLDGKTVVIDYYYIKNITLMTPNGPCIITDETFTCPE